VYGTSQYCKKIPAKVARELMLAEEETEILEVAVIAYAARISRPAPKNKAPCPIKDLSSSHDG